MSAQTGYLTTTVDSEPMQPKRALAIALARRANRDTELSPLEYWATLTTHARVVTYGVEADIIATILGSLGFDVVARKEKRPARRKRARAR